MKKLLLLSLLACAALSFAGGPRRVGLMSSTEIDYLDAGEHLLHGFSPISTKRMPFSTVGVALSFNRAPVPRAAFRAAEAILIAVLSFLLMPNGIWPTAAALLALKFFGGDFLWALDSNAEAPVILLILLVAGWMALRAERPSLKNTFLLALGIGVTLLYRSVLAFFPPILVLFESATSFRGSFRRYWPHAVLICAVPYLFLLPWVRLTSALGHEVALFEVHGADANIAAAALGLNSAVEGDWKTLVPVPERPQAAQGVLRWAIRRIARHPWLYARGFGERLAWVFSLHPLLWMLALTALWIFRRNAKTWGIGLLVFYLVIVYCLMAVQQRYYDPLWPLLATLAGGLASLRPNRVPVPSASPRWARAGLAAGLAVSLALAVFVEWLLLTVLPAQAETEESLSVALGRWPRDPWLLAERGNLRLKDGAFASAAADLSSAAMRWPSDPQLQLKAAWAASLAGRPKPPFPDLQEDAQLQATSLILQGALEWHRGARVRAREYFHSARETFDSKRGGWGNDAALREQALWQRSFLETFLNSIDADWLRDLPSQERREILRELLLPPRAQGKD